MNIRLLTLFFYLHILSKFPQDVTKTSFSISPDHPIITLKYMALKTREGSSLSLKASLAPTDNIYIHKHWSLLGYGKMGKKKLATMFSSWTVILPVLPLSNQACLACCTCMNTTSSLDKIHIRWPS